MPGRRHWVLSGNYVQGSWLHRRKGYPDLGYLQLRWSNIKYVSHAWPILSNTHNCIDLIFIVFLLDRVGRRKPLLFGTIGITLALICEGAINSQNTSGTRHSLSIAGVFFIFLVSIIFSFSFGPISWVYMGEVMPM